MQTSQLNCNASPLIGFLYGADFLIGGVSQQTLKVFNRM